MDILRLLAAAAWTIWRSRRDRYGRHNRRGRHRGRHEDDD